MNSEAFSSIPKRGPVSTTLRGDQQRKLRINGRSIRPGVQRLGWDRSSSTIPVVVAAPTVLEWPLLDECFSEAAGYFLVRAQSTAEGVEAACSLFGSCVLIVEQDLAEAGLRGRIRQLGLGVRALTVLRTAHLREDVLEHLVCDGYVGFLFQLSVDDLQRAARAVAVGELWLSRKLISGLLRKLMAKSFQKLTAREAEIHSLKQAGDTNQQIAARLFVSRETVRWHIRNLNQKLGADFWQGGSVPVGQPGPRTAEPPRIGAISSREIA